MKINITRHVNMPSRSYGKPAGIDFYVPAFNEKFLSDLNAKNSNLEDSCKYSITIKSLIEPNSKSCITLMPNSRILIPSGVRTILEPGTYLEAKNKSGVAHKKGLIVGSCVVDEDYRGEIHLSLINTTMEPVHIYENEKIVQFIQQKYEMNPLEQVSDEEFESDKTERGDKGFGSSNNQ